MASKRQHSPCIDIILDAAKQVGVKLSDTQSNRILSELGNHAVAIAPQFGGDVVKAMRKVAEDAALSVKIRRLAFKRSKILKITAEKQLTTLAKQFVQEGYTYGEGVLAAIEGSEKAVFGAKDSIDARYEGYNKKWVSDVGNQIKAIIPEKELRSGVHNLDIAKERGELSKGANGQPGITGNKVAADVAKVLHENWLERTRLINKAGGYRRPLEGFYGEQSHEPDRIKRLGMTPQGYNKDVAFKEWSTRMLARLDHVATFKGNPPMEFLKAAFNNLETHDFTHSSFDSVDSFPNGMSLADRVSQKERVFVFKDAESYVAHQQEFGRNDLLDTVYSGITFDARSLAVMEKVGPDGFNSVNKVVNQLKVEAKKASDSERQVASINEGRLIGAWRIASGEADMPGNGWMAKTQATIQNVAVSSGFGSVIFSTPGDAAFQGLWSSRNGLGLFSQLAKDIGYLFGSNNSPENIAKRAELIELGVFADSFAHNGTGRYAIHEKGANFLSKSIQFQFDFLGLNWWTRSLKAASADALMTGLAAHETLPLHALPENRQIMLSRYGINPLDWEAMKKGIKQVGDERWMTTEGLDPKLQQKLRSMILSELDIAVPTPGARERRYLTFGGTRAGTPSGTLARLVGFIHSYAVSVNSKVLPQEVYGRGNKSWKEWATGEKKFSNWGRAASLGAASFALTWAGMSAKDLLSGRTPRSFVKDDGTPNWGNIREVANRSGAAGLMGELITQEWQRGFKDPSTYLSGVLVQKYVDPLATIPWDIARGDERWKGKTVELGKSLIPGINMLFVRQVADYMILSRLQEFVDHGSIDRAKSNLEKRTGQTYFADPENYFLK